MRICCIVLSLLLKRIYVNNKNLVTDQKKCIREQYVTDYITVLREVLCVKQKCSKNSLSNSKESIYFVNLKCGIATFLALFMQFSKLC